MRDSGLVSFGSHSRRHTRLLAHLDAGTLDDEVRMSRRILERDIGRPVEIFCFPNGDYSSGSTGLCPGGLPGCRDDGPGLERDSRRSPSAQAHVGSRGHLGGRGQFPGPGSRAGLVEHGPMKTILHVIDTTGPGGAETVFVALAAGLDPARYRSLALIRGAGWVRDSLEARGIPTFILDCKGSFNLRYLRDLVALIRRERIDVIQSHLLGSNVYCAIAGMLARRPVIATFHGTVDIAATGEVCRRSSSASCGGVAGRSWSCPRLWPGQSRPATRCPLRRTEVIYNGIDTRAFAREAQPAAQGPAGTARAMHVLVGALGNIRPAKDYSTLLQAFALVAARLPAVHLVIAGEGSGSRLAALEAERQALGLVQTGFTFSALARIRLST